MNIRLGTCGNLKHLKFNAFNISFPGIEATTKKFCYVTKAIEKTIAMVRLANKSEKSHLQY